VFPSGATIQFGFLDSQNDRFQYQGAELQFVGFDELRAPRAKKQPKQVEQQEAVQVAVETAIVQVPEPVVEQPVVAQPVVIPLDADELPALETDAIDAPPGPSDLEPASDTPKIGRPCKLTPEVTLKVCKAIKA